jgi:hypothetical protein
LTPQCFHPGIWQTRASRLRLSKGSEATAISTGRRPFKPGRRFDGVDTGEYESLDAGKAYLVYLCLAMDKDMNKEKLVRIVQELLKTDQDLDFLMELEREQLERLVACIRDRIDH